MRSWLSGLFGGRDQDARAMDLLEQSLLLLHGSLVSADTDTVEVHRLLESISPLHAHEPQVALELVQCLCSEITELGCDPRQML